MFLSFVYTELLKYKRTIIPWIIGIGGLLAATTSLLLVSTEDSQVSYEVLAGRGLNLINILALILVAVFSGYVFVTEYYESTISILFTYPVSRFKLYIVKYFVILLMVISLYLAFFLSTIIFGFINIRKLPSMDFALNFMKLIFVVSCTNFVLVPVTTLVSIIIKEIGTYIIVGMSYCIAYICFINSEYSLFIPVCIPDKLVANYFIPERISKADFKGIVIVSVITFLSTFFIGAVCYSKSDIYKLD